MLCLNSTVVEDISQFLDSGAYAGKNNKGVRDRRKLREKRRSTGVMHLPSTESTGGSTGEDENIENSAPPGSSLNKSCTATVEPDRIVLSKHDRRFVINLKCKQLDLQISYKYIK